MSKIVNETEVSFPSEYTGPAQDDFFNRFNTSDLDRAASFIQVDDTLTQRIFDDEKAESLKKAIREYSSSDEKLNNIVKKKEQLDNELAESHKKVDEITTEKKNNRSDKHKNNEQKRKKAHHSIEEQKKMSDSKLQDAKEIAKNPYLDEPTKVNRLNAIEQWFHLSYKVIRKTNYLALTIGYTAFNFCYNTVSGLYRASERKAIADLSGDMNFYKEKLERLENKYKERAIERNKKYNKRQTIISILTGSDAKHIDILRPAYTKKERENLSALKREIRITEKSLLEHTNILKESMHKKDNRTEINMGLLKEVVDIEKYLRGKKRHLDKENKEKNEAHKKSEEKENKKKTNPKKEALFSKNTLKDTIGLYSSYMNDVDTLVEKYPKLDNLDGKEWIARLLSNDIPVNDISKYIEKGLTVKQLDNIFKYYHNLTSEELDLIANPNLTDEIHLGITRSLAIGNMTYEEGQAAVEQAITGKSNSIEDGLNTLLTKIDTSIGENGMNAMYLLASDTFPNADDIDYNMTLAYDEKQHDIYVIANIQGSFSDKTVQSKSIEILKIDADDFANIEFLNHSYSGELLAQIIQDKVTSFKENRFLDYGLGEHLIQIEDNWDRFFDVADDYAENTALGLNDITYALDLYREIREEQIRPVTCDLFDNMDNINSKNDTTRSNVEIKGAKDTRQAEVPLGQNNGEFGRSDADRAEDDKEKLSPLQEKWLKNSAGIINKKNIGNIEAADKILKKMKQLPEIHKELCIMNERLMLSVDNNHLNMNIYDDNDMKYKRLNEQQIIEIFAEDIVNANNELLSLEYITEQEKDYIFEEKYINDFNLNR